MTLPNAAAAAKRTMTVFQRNCLCYIWVYRLVALADILWLPHQNTGRPRRPDRTRDLMGCPSSIDDLSCPLDRSMCKGKAWIVYLQISVKKQYIGFSFSFSCASRPNADWRGPKYMYYHIAIDSQHLVITTDYVIN